MLSRRTVLGGAAAATWLVADLPGAHATQVLALDLNAMTSTAPVIIVGEVLAISADRERAGKRILTTVQILVHESWRGPIQADQRINIVQPGGTVGDIQMKVHGMPRFSVGQRAVLFLRSRFELAEGASLTPADDMTVVGLAQGKRDMFQNSEKAIWMVQPTSREAAVVRAPDGRLQAAPADDSALRLAGLRSQVMQILKRPPVARP